MSHGCCCMCLHLSNWSTASPATKNAFTTINMSLACPYAAQPPTLWSQVPSDGQAKLLLIQDNVKSLESAITWLSCYMLFPSSTTKLYMFTESSSFIQATFSDASWCFRLCAKLSEMLMIFSETIATQLTMPTRCSQGR